jgi:hypothetical protein
MIALPEAGTRPQELERLAPRLRTTLWPGAGKTEDLARLVVDRLGEVSVSLGERLEALGELAVLRATVVDEAAIPPARSSAGMAVFALAGEMRASIGADFVGRAAPSAPRAAHARDRLGGEEEALHWPSPRR